MRQAVTTAIDSDLCVGCGACVDVCPSDTLCLRQGVAVVTGTESLNCGHCEAVCPEGAARVGALDRSASQYATFAIDETWLGHGAFDTASLVRLMASRRSCRSFTDEPVDRGALEDLVKIGATAPSGTNSQQWSFTVLPTRQAVLAAARPIWAFFELLNKLSDHRSLRLLSKVVASSALEIYHRDYSERIKEAIAEFERGGRERLFHGAPAAIFVGSKPGASTGAEDALLATQNILLAAHAMGFGTCLVGFAVAAIGRDARIKKQIGIPKQEKIHAVIALGHPNESYERVAGRLPITMRVVEG